MLVKDMKTINLLNYNDSIVTVNTKHDSYVFEPAIDSENPTIIPLTMDEIIYINSNSAAFKCGFLRFPKEIEKEMYEDVLRIPHWESLLTVKEIEDIILYPTVDGLNKLIGIKNQGVFDIVRGVFVRLKNSTENDISLRVESIIKKRTEELRRGIKNSAIIIKTKDTVANVSNDEADALKAQNEMLNAKLQEMQKMMEQMAAMQNGQVSTESEGETVAEKRPGRPKNNK